MKQKYIKIPGLLLCIIISISAIAQSRVTIDGLNYRLRGTEAHVSGYVGSPTEVVIPATVEYENVTYGVTSIGGYAFSSCSGLTSVTIPNSVTSIGDYAFSGCKALFSVTICCDLTSTGSYIFSNCEKLSSIAFHCQKIPSLFSNLTSIKEVIIGDEVTSIGDHAFRDCSGLTSVDIPNSVTSIGNYAFQNCSGLTSVTIPNSVTSIGYDAFDGCSGLTSVTIPNSVTSIGGNAFEGTAWLNNQNEGILYLDNWLIGFKGQQPTGDHVIVDGTKGIASQAFYDCRGLTSVSIPNSVTSIGNNAFSSCSGLTSVTIPNSVTSIGNNAFNGCRGLTDITIPNCVTSIEEGTFQGCANLTTITIPSSVKSIYGNAFEGCSKISSVNISDLAAWCNISFLDGRYPYISKEYANPFYANNEHHLYLNGKEVTNLDISQDATAIHEKAFYNCKSITSVSIPNSVTEIGNGAFSGCDNLLTVNSEITEPFNCKDAFSNETLRKGMLYVPAGTKDLYARFDGWREFLKIEEVGGEAEQSVWLSIKDAQGTTKIKIKKGTKQELMISPEEGWKILSVTMDGTDVTAQATNGGSFTTPAINSDASIIIVYEQEVPSGVRAARSQANVKVVSDGFVISNAEPDTRCVIYSTDGQQVVNTVISEGTKKITLQQGQVYILTIDGRTLKFAL